MTTWGSYAARSAETLDEAWTGTLTISDLFNITTLFLGTVHPVQDVAVSAIGCAAGIELYAHGDETDVADAGWPQEAQDEVDAYHVWRAAQAPAPPPPPPPVTGSWWLFRFYVTATGDSDEHYICIGVATYLGAPATLYYGDASYAATYTMGATNIVLKSRGGDSTPATRGTRDFVDQHVGDAWHVTDTTVSSATMTVPASELGAKGDISASGSWASMPGLGELTGSWPTTLQLGYTITYNDNAETAVDYIQIAPQWQGRDLGLWALDDHWWNAEWHHWWDGSAFQSPWPPSGVTENYKVYGDGTTIKARRVISPDSGVTWTGTSNVPYVLRVVIQSGKWNDGGGDW